MTGNSLLFDVHFHETAQAAEITRKPNAEQTVAEGQDVTIHCRYFGAPKPVLTWKIGPDDNRIPINDPRFIPQSNGDLLIKVKWLKLINYAKMVCSKHDDFGKRSRN